MMPDSVWLVLMGLGLAGFLWTVANVLEAWRLERRRLRLVKPRRRAVVIKFSRRAS